MGRTVVRTLAHAMVVGPVALVVTFGVAFGASATSGASAGSGTSICTPVVHSWAGRATVEPGQSFHTGSLVTAPVGVQLAVDAHDVSTDVPAPAVSLLIGETPVADGAPVVGGEISVVNGGADSVVVTRVEISIEECVQVEVAPPLPPAVGTVPPAPIDLPATGAAEVPAALAGGALAGVGGAVLVAVRRGRRTTHPRPVTASGRDR